MGMTFFGWPAGFTAARSLPISPGVQMPIPETLSSRKDVTELLQYSSGQRSGFGRFVGALAGEHFLREGVFSADTNQNQKKKK